MRGALMMTLGALALAGCGASPAPVETATAPAIEPVKFTSACPADDVMAACASDKAAAATDLEKALAGDYQAQRNVSYSHTAAQPWNVQQPVQGCAWRMVIMVSAPASSTLDDASMYRTQCGSLSPADLKAATEVAELIHQRIHGVPLPALPPIPA